MILQRFQQFSRSMQFSVKISTKFTPKTKHLVSQFSEVRPFQSFSVKNFRSIPYFQILSHNFKAFSTMFTKSMMIFENFQTSKNISNRDLTDRESLKRDFLPVFRETQFLNHLVILQKAIIWKIF